MSRRAMGIRLATTWPCECRRADRRPWWPCRQRAPRPSRTTIPRRQGRTGRGTRARPSPARSRGAAVQQDDRVGQQHHGHQEVDHDQVGVELGVDDEAPEPRLGHHPAPGALPPATPGPGGTAAAGTPRPERGTTIVRDDGDHTVPELDNRVQCKLGGEVAAGSRTASPGSPDRNRSAGPRPPSPRSGPSGRRYPAVAMRPKRPGLTCRYLSHRLPLAPLLLWRCRAQVLPRTRSYRWRSG